MTWGLTAVAGATLVGGYLGSQGAKSAAETQAGAATKSGELQKQMFDEQMRLQDPYRQAGLIGQTRLMTLLGLGGTQPSGGGGGLIGGVGNALAGAAAGPRGGSSRGRAPPPPRWGPARSRSRTPHSRRRPAAPGPRAAQASASETR